MDFWPLLDGIPHLEDQWLMEDGFVSDDGVFMCGDSFVLILNELEGIIWEIG